MVVHTVTVFQYTPLAPLQVAGRDRIEQDVRTET